MSTKELPDYYRKDQKSGITPPNLLNRHSIPEHIVHARGKKTNYTSVSLDSDRIRSFGEQLYAVRHAELKTDEHKLIEHAQVLLMLKKFIHGGDKKQKNLALRAIPRAKKTLEGLIDWKFKELSSIKEKDLLKWTKGKIQKYFKRA